MESKISFLVESGAQVSLLPATSGVKCSSPSKFTLWAVNGSLIYILVRSVCSRTYTHIFIAADVGCATLGAGFLQNFGLVIDIHRHCLRNQETLLKASGVVKAGTSLRPTVAQAIEEDVVWKLIKEYPLITIPLFNKETLPHTTTHYIEINDPPIHNRARSLAPDKLKAAKAESQQKMKLGIVLPPKSKWSSPIHLVSKNSNTWRACDGYGALNVVTKPDKYPVLYKKDLTAVAPNNRIFTKLDQIRVYHQIPVEPEHITKTTITTPFGLFEFLRVPFGWRNAAQTFQRFID